MMQGKHGSMSEVKTMGMRNMMTMLVIAMMIAGVARSAFAESEVGTSGSSEPTSATTQNSDTSESQQHSIEQQAEQQKHDAEQRQASAAASNTGSSTDAGHSENTNQSLGSGQRTSNENAPEHGNETLKEGSWDFSHDFGGNEEHRINVTGNVTAGTTNSTETNGTTDTNETHRTSETNTTDNNFTEFNDTSPRGNDLPSADLRIDTFAAGAAQAQEVTIKGIQQELSASQARIAAAEQQKQSAEQALGAAGTAETGANGTPALSGGTGPAVDTSFLTKLLTWLGILH
jgi:hypothetical protein